MRTQVPYLTPESALPRRAPHPFGYKLAKAKNAKMLTLINAISDRLDKAGPWPQVSDDVVAVRGMIVEWRDNG